MTLPRVDNFDLFPREFRTGEFYFVQVIERHKDNPEKSGLNGGNSCRVLKSYVVSSEEELNKRIPILKEYCTKYKARCYVHPSRRSEKAIAYDMIIMLGEFLKRSCHNLSRIFDSACGSSLGVERLWIIDIDTKDYSVVESIKKTIEEWGAGVGKEMYSYTLPTLNGYHIITTPFDSRILSGVSIQKNNPTLLYFN